MEEHGVRQIDLAVKLGKSTGYISGRIGKKSPSPLVDTDMLDALGELADLNTVALMAEMTRRMAAAGDPSARRRQEVGPYAAALRDLDETERRQGDPPPSRKRAKPSA